MNKVRSMLISSGLPKVLYGEATIAATYIYNRTSYISLKDSITSYEARYREKSNRVNIRT